MDEPHLPDPPNRKGRISGTRFVIWIVLIGVGAYLVISGLIGIIVKGQ